MITIHAEEDTFLQPRLLNAKLRKVTQQLSDTLTYNLATQQHCVVPGLGEFELKIIAGRFVINPKTKQQNYRQAYYQLSFTPSPGCLTRIKHALEPQHQTDFAAKVSTIDSNERGVHDAS